MTAQEIADRYVQSEKGTSELRTKKMIALCQRSNVAVKDVIALLPYDVRVQLEQTP